MAADGEQPGAGENVDAGTATDVLNKGPWYGDLPETNDDEKAFKQWADKKAFKDPLSALKGYRELEKQFGSNRVALPGEKDDLSQWEGWDKLGVPKEAKDYVLERPQLPEGMQWDEAFEAQAKEAAAKLRIPPAQLKGMMDLLVQSRVAEFNGMKEHQAKESGELQTLFKEWGAEKDVNIELAKRGAKFLGLSKEETAALESGLLGSKTLMSAMLKIGKNVREGSSMDAGASPLIGKEAATAELARINERIGRGEKLTAEEMKTRSALYKQIHG